MSRGVEIAGSAALILKRPAARSCQARAWSLHAIFRWVLLLLSRRRNKLDRESTPDCRQAKRLLMANKTVVLSDQRRTNSETNFSRRRIPWLRTPISDRAQN